MHLIPLYLYMVILYVRPQDWVPFMQEWPMADILIPTGVVIGYINYMSAGNSSSVPQTWLWAPYLFVIFVSTFVNTDLNIAIDQFVIFLKRVLVFLMVFWSVSTEDSIRNTLRVMLVLSAFLVYQGVLQAVTGYGWGGATPLPNYEELRIRWHGDWDGPNVLGILFVMATAVSLEYVMAGSSFVVRLTNAALWLAYMAGIFMTNSRGAILAVAASIVFYFRERFKNIKAIALGLLSVVLLFAFGPSRVSEIDSSESSAHARTWLWEQGLRMLQENLIFGVGRGQFKSNTDLGLIAHNNYVQNFAELGLVGFFLFSAILWYTFKGNYLFSSGTYKTTPVMQSYCRMMTTLLVGYCAATFFVVMEHDLLYFVLGLGAAIHVAAARQSQITGLLRLSIRDLVAIGICATSIIAVVWLVSENKSFE